MIISHSKKILFVHVPKTGGSTIRNLLLRQLPDARPFLGQHEAASVARERLGEEFEAYFRFAFVRNPWDRIVSWYSMIEQAGKQEQIRTRSKQHKNRPYILQNARSFDDFIRDSLDLINHANNTASFLDNQLDYIADGEGKLLVNEVGRYEHFEHDLRRILCRIGIQETPIPHVNRSYHSHYSWYYSEQNQQIVRRLCQKDIDYFNYKFEADD